MYQEDDVKPVKEWEPFGSISLLYPCKNKPAHYVSVLDLMQQHFWSNIKDTTQRNYLCSKYEKQEKSSRIIPKYTYSWTPYALLDWDTFLSDKSQTHLAVEKDDDSLWPKHWQAHEAVAQT
jgi:hypothetical protein